MHLKDADGWLEEDMPITHHDHVMTTAHEAALARDVLSELEGPEGVLLVERVGDPARRLPNEIGRILQEVLDVMARGGRVTIGAVPDELTTSAAAAILGVSRPTLMKMVRAGELPAHKVGSHHRLKADDVYAARRQRRARERAAFDALRDMDDSAE